jgi:S1-C subfamily serine protease
VRLGKIKIYVQFFVIMILMASCTFHVNISTTNVPAVDKYDISESFKSVGMLALQRKGHTKVSGIGTAFAYDDDTLLTAGHVCTSINSYQIINSVDRSIWLVYLGRSDKLARRKGGKIKNIDSVNDICHIEFKGHGLAPLKIADYSTLKFGDNVFIVGAPSGVMLSLTEGMVMNKSSSGLIPMSINNRLVISAAATSGHSGSPILNDKGEVVGILIMGHIFYDHLSFGVKVPIVKRFLKLIGK